MASISLAGLTKRFGDLTAVASLDLEIGDKEFFALLGPSGCGKTTTMNHDRRNRDAVGRADSL